MKKVAIAKLKAHLSAYLRDVRGGETVIVLDRKTPIARLVPMTKERPVLVIHPPEPGTPPLGKFPIPAALSFKGDIMEFLLQERQNWR